MGVRLSEQEINDLMTTVFVDATATGDNQALAAPGSGFKYAIFGYQISCGGTANNVRFRSGTNSISSLKSLAINGGSNVAPGERPLFETNNNEALNINLSGATQVGVDIQYVKARV